MIDFLVKRAKRSAARRSALVAGLAMAASMVIAPVSAEQSLAARHQLVPFAQAVDPNAAEQYGAKHLRYVAEKLEAVERGEIPRLIVELPIRHWKSSLGSEKFPAFVLGKNPKKEIIACSYGVELPLQFSGSVRDIIGGEAFKSIFPGVALKHGSTRQDRWSLRGAYRHSYRAAGVGGAVTGMGADLLLIDDPVKDAIDLATEDARNKLYNWYRSKVRTRLNPGGAIVIIMSRWHEDDLVGKLLAAMAEGGEQWEVVHLPALAELDDPLGREPGEALWPERWDIGQLAEARISVGALVWASQYQQTPKPDGGYILDSGKLKRAERSKVCLPGEKPTEETEYRITRMVRYWDLAFSEAQGADAMAGVLCGLDQKKRFIILDVVHLKGRWPINKQKLIDQALADPPGVIQIIESNGTQLGYAQDIKDEPKLRTRHVRGFNPGEAGNKETRASMWGSRLDDGIICAVTAPWLQMTCSQIDSFGAKGAHDDIVDGISGCWAALYISGRNGLMSV